jgi:tRNA G18 (ribose-2'-O)-methylase SpoU
VEVLVDNVRSLYNVGAIFRTADGAGIRRLHLCGITPTPENPKLAKTALGAEESVAWRYWPNALEAAQALQADGAYLMALERTPAALLLQSAQPTPKTLLIVGNEVAGVDPAILDLADVCIAIPMAGRKRSLNVATAFGIAAYVIAGWV